MVANENGPTQYTIKFKKKVLAYMLEHGRDATLKKYKKIHRTCLYRWKVSEAAGKFDVYTKTQQKAVYKTHGGGKKLQILPHVQDQLLTWFDLMRNNEIRVTIKNLAHQHNVFVGNNNVPNHLLCRRIRLLLKKKNHYPSCHSHCTKEETRHRHVYRLGVIHQ
jgi:hypothetical protein